MCKQIVKKIACGLVCTNICSEVAVGFFQTIYVRIDWLLEASSFLSLLRLFSKYYIFFFKYGNSAWEMSDVLNIIKQKHFYVTGLAATRFIKISLDDASLMIIIQFYYVVVFVLHYSHYPFTEPSETHADLKWISYYEQKILVNITAKIAFCTSTQNKPQPWDSWLKYITDAKWEYREICNE